MTRSSLAACGIAWGAVWAFWFVLTRDAHPTRQLAVVVTTALVVAYAIAAFVHHRFLVPRFWARGRRLQWAGWLAATMVALTAAALAVIRTAYTASCGPDADPNGLYQHFAIDLFGMAVHVAAAAAVVGLWNRRAARAAEGSG